MSRLALLAWRWLGGPPLSPALAFAPSSLPHSFKAGSSTEYGIQKLIEDTRIVLGVPKMRTSKMRKMTRKFSYTRMLSPVEEVVTCEECGTAREADTICKVCYEKVREVTNQIKEKMMDYNPYTGERQTTYHVKFANEKKPSEGVLNGKRVIELKGERPTWFRQPKNIDQD